MITINKYLYFAAVSAILCVPSLASNSNIEAPTASAVTSATSKTVGSIYDKECAYIDGFLDQEARSKIDRQQMDPSVEALIEYSMTYVSKSGTEVGRYWEAIMGLKKTTDLLDLDWFNTMSETDKFRSICFSEVLRAATTWEPTGIKKQKMARATTLMLTPEFANAAVREKWSKHPYPLVRIAAEYANQILDLRYRKLIEENSSSAHVLQGQTEGDHFTTCYMFNKFSTYQLKTFFYALSKGVVLEGINPAKFAGHGCLFPFALLAQSHDEGHAEELRGHYEISLGSNYAVVALKNFSNQFLDILHKGQVFAQSEVDLALLGAFMMVHETQIKAFIEPCLKDLSYATNIDLSKLSTSISHKLGYEKFKADYPLNFIYRFYSDMAFELIRVKPELTGVLFPQGTDVVQSELLQEDDFHSNKPLSYNLDRTIEESVRLMTWFMDRLSPHLTTVRVLN